MFAVEIGEAELVQLEKVTSFCVRYVATWNRFVDSETESAATQSLAELIHDGMQVSRNWEAFSRRMLGVLAEGVASDVLDSDTGCDATDGGE